MYYRQASSQYIVEGMQFTIDNVTYPSTWLLQANEQDKTNLGLVKVQVIGEFKDGKYYNNSEVLDGASLTITSTAKPLADVKEQAIKDINNTAYSILLPSDWMASRKAENGTAIPTEWSVWRESVRTTTSNAITAVNTCTTVDAVATVMSNIVWAKDPSNAV